MDRLSIMMIGTSSLQASYTHWSRLPAMPAQRYTRRRASCRGKHRAIASRPFQRASRSFPQRKSSLLRVLIRLNSCANWTCACPCSRREATRLRCLGAMRDFTRPIMFSESKALLTPMGNDLRLGGVLELTRIDSPLAMRRASALIKSVPSYLSLESSFDGIEPWSGYRPCSPDGFPIVGRSHRWRNLLYATGHGMLGLNARTIYRTRRCCAGYRQRTRVRYEPHAAFAIWQVNLVGDRQRIHSACERATAARGGEHI